MPCPARLSIGAEMLSHTQYGLVVGPSNSTIGFALALRNPASA